jgi:hypothetical protein
MRTSFRDPHPLEGYVPVVLRAASAVVVAVVAQLRGIGVGGRVVIVAVVIAARAVIVDVVIEGAGIIMLAGAQGADRIADAVAGAEALDAAVVGFEATGGRRFAGALVSSGAELACAVITSGETGNAGAVAVVGAGRTLVGGGIASRGVGQVAVIVVEAGYAEVFADQAMGATRHAQAVLIFGASDTAALIGAARRFWSDAVGVHGATQAQIGRGIAGGAFGATRQVVGGTLHASPVVTDWQSDHALAFAVSFAGRALCG